VVQSKQFIIDSSGSLQQEKNLISHLDSIRENLLSDALFFPQKIKIFSL
jgi:hypothetical protein